MKKVKYIRKCSCGKESEALTPGQYVKLGPNRFYKCSQNCVKATNDVTETKTVDYGFIVRLSDF